MNKELDVEAQEFDKMSVGFERYREICDTEEPGYRRTGLLDKDMYEKSLLDTRTILVETEVGNAPLVVPIEYSEGYDIERCKRLTGKSDLYLLTLPPHLVQSYESFNFLGSDSAIIVESADDFENLDWLKSPNPDQQMQSKLAINQFIDPRIEKEDYQPAWMGMYSARLDPVAEEASNNTGDLKKTFEHLGKPLIPANGTTIFDKKDFMHHPEVMESLWELFEDRFEWLGDYHPVSMEDKRGAFIQAVLNDETYTYLKFMNQELVCAGIFMHGTDDITWVKQDIFEAYECDEETPQLQKMYFFGISAKKDNDVTKNMEEVVHTHCELAQLAGIHYLLFFESSNMSSQYIPRVTESYVNSSNALRVAGHIQQTSRTNYGYITSA